MKLKNGWSFFIFLFIVLIATLGGPGCANIVPPLGGPRDTLPPRLLTVTPRDSAVHVTGNKIVFNFDEYLDPKDIRTELLVSPVPKIDPIVEAHLRTLTVRIKDTLEPNTTYFFDFGKAVRDVNEGNILRNFSYVFSTGNHIDQGELTGTVVVASTGKVDTTIVVMLHVHFDDSAVVKNRPRYLARVDSTGRFHFRYIQPGSYALYAMKDDGGSHKYLSKGQLFAFADSPVVIGQHTSAQSLYAYAEAETKPPSKSTQTTAPKSAAARAAEKEREKRLQFQTNLSNNEFDVLDTFHLIFPNPLQVFDSTRIRFTNENFLDIDPKTYRFERDTTNKKFSLLYNWPTGTKFYLIAARDFAKDSAGRILLKTDTVKIQTKKDIEYGEVRIRVLNLDLTNKPVLEFVQSDVVKYAFPFSTRKEVRKRLFTPGEYELRILYDINGNGKWDPGEFFDKRRQPERVTWIRKKLTVKANWDNDLDVTL